MAHGLLLQTQKTCRKLVAVGIRFNRPERPMPMRHWSTPGVLRQPSSSQRRPTCFHIEHLHCDSVCVLQVHPRCTCGDGNGSAEVDLVSVDSETIDGLRDIRWG